MKKIFLLFSVALTSAAIATSCCSNEAPSAEASILNNIMTRTSVRSYTSQAVEAEKIETLLKAGMAAPTGSNKQPWEFVVITDPAILAQLPSVAGGMRMADKAPLAIVVLGDESISSGWVLDCCAATENILLAAHAMGLGAVWCGAYSTPDDARAVKMREILDLPEGIHSLNAIIIGYPDSEPIIKDKWKPSKVHYNGYTK